MKVNIKTEEVILKPGDFGLRKGNLNKIFKIDRFFRYRDGCVLELSVYPKYLDYIKNNLNYYSIENCFEIEPLIVIDEKDLTYKLQRYQNTNDSFELVYSVL